MINHKQSVAEHAALIAEGERREQARHARRVGKVILREIEDMVLYTGSRDEADAYFNPTVVRTRAKVHGVVEELLHLTEEVVEQGRNHD